MLENYFVQTCQLISITRNKYGDYVDGTRTTLNCRWRDIGNLRQGTHQEQRDADAMVWLSASSGVVRGSILLFEGVFYQVDKITQARRLGETTVQFIKCDVKVKEIAAS